MSQPGDNDSSTTSTDRLSKTFKARAVRPLQPAASQDKKAALEFLRGLQNTIDDALVPPPKGIDEHLWHRYKTVFISTDPATREKTTHFQNDPISGEQLADGNITAVHKNAPGGPVVPAALIPAKKPQAASPYSISPPQL